MKVSSARARQAILVNDGIPLDSGHVPDHLALFDAEGNRIYFSGTHGIPAGGTAGQMLVKLSDDDFDVGWIDIPVGTGGGDPDEDPPSIYPINDAYTLASDATTHLPTVLHPQPLKGSDFPVSFDTTDKPFTEDRDSRAVAYWIRVVEAGTLTFNATTTGTQDGYGRLYNAQERSDGDYSAVASNDDGAGTMQPRLTVDPFINVGDYILLYTGYRDDEMGPAQWEIDPASTAVLAEEFTGPAPVPPVAVNIGETTGGFERYGDGTADSFTFTIAAPITLMGLAFNDQNGWTRQLSIRNSGGVELAHGVTFPAVAITTTLVVPTELPAGTYTVQLENLRNGIACSNSSARTGVLTGLTAIVGGTAYPNFAVWGTS